MSRLAVPGWIVLLATAAGAQTTTELTEQERRGEALLARLCASCHATGRAGAGPRPAAPPFRTLGRRYPIESLEEALGEGLLSAHSDMPELALTADQVGEAIGYLKAIQEP